MLDSSCGSGMLAIVTLTLGGRRAVTVDRDDQALLVAQPKDYCNACDH
ncbi:MAG: 50S ribosomal protein L11 methyltransferase [Pseudomonadota bacterium]|nr:50S ribosomal protein L11 methyltransferase [Pseudomonadota bacterium]